MKKPVLAELLYQRTFRQPKQGDPPNFFAHIQRNIVSEVRIEVQAYYGALDTLEAQYPGLDYTFPPHRRRLERQTWHRRLFRAFDDLALTDAEILTLCQWEGTRAAKERYEKEAGMHVKSTTADDVVAASMGNGPKAVFQHRRPASVDSESSNETLVASLQARDKGKAVGNAESYFLDLLRNAVSQMTSDPSATSEQWEQWLKDILDQGNMDLDLAMDAIHNLQPEAMQALQHRINEDITGPAAPQPRIDYDNEVAIAQMQPVPASNSTTLRLVRASQAETAR